MDKLLKAVFICEVYYPDWLANVVIVKKLNKNWWVCNTPRAQRRVVHIKDMEERKQHQLDTFWAEYRQRTPMLSVLDLGTPRDG